MTNTETEHTKPTVTSSAVEKSQPLVPQLRFAEFGGKWNKHVLGKIATFSKGKNISKADIVEDGQTECIRYGELYTEYEEVITDIKSKTNIPIEELVFSEENDVIIPASGETQIDIATAACVTKGNVALGGDLNIIKTEKDGIFLSYYLNSEKKFDIARLAQGNAVVHIYNSQLKSLKLNFPTLPEQQKIASFLSSVDTKLRQLTEKKELLEQYKKGVMQQLFNSPLEGGEGGCLRFTKDDGSNYPDWEEKKYGEIFKFYSTNSFSRDNLNYTDGNVKNIHYGDIHTKFKTRFNISKEDVPFINEEIDISRIKDECYCRIGDLVIADASEDYHDIGKSIEVINLNNEKVLAGLHTFLARPDKAIMAVGFAGYLTQSYKVRIQIMKIAQGTKVLGLATSRLGKIRLSIPSKEEQQQIANFLSSLDAKIESVAQQITQTQQFKKGLLQQLFV